MTEELLDNLTEDLQEETLDLESLIRDGADYRKTIIIELPNGSKGACTIRPLTSNEWNQCTNKYLKLKGSMELYVCEKGLLNKKGEPFPKELLEIFPAGVIQEIFKEIQSISGIKRNNEEEQELTRQLLDF